MTGRRRQEGLSIVELMVGLAIGLVVTAAALLAMTHHLRENRTLLMEARLVQDLRTATDLIARDLRRAGPMSLVDGTARFTYPESSEPLAYRLREGVIEMQIGSGHWQAMTDINTLRVAAFSITPHTAEIALEGFCSRPCPEGSTSCPPRQTLRSVSISVEARATADATAIHHADTSVQLRHDALDGACPT